MRTASRTTPRGDGWRGSLALALACTAALIAISVLLRAHALGGFAAYSDIKQFYQRDHLALHPAPYFDYRLEYPVVLGAFIWLVGFAHSSVAAYFVVTAAVLGLCGLLTVWALSRIPGANPWLFALAPGLAWFGVLNWDLAALALLVIALLAHQRGRDGWGGALLALAVWAKFFPLVVLPVVLAVRAAERRWRSCLHIVVAFAAVTAVVNLPVAIRVQDGGVAIRSTWAYFFEFTHDRPAESTLWQTAHLTVPTTNWTTGVLLVAGIGVIAALVLRRGPQAREALTPGSAAALLWLFATAKTYSPQYTLWAFVAMALVAAPLAGAAILAVLDTVIVTTDLGGLSSSGAIDEIAEVAFDLRQVVTAILAAWVAARIARPVDQPSMYELAGSAGPIQAPSASTGGGG